MKLTRAFYARPTLDVAADLLGKVLVQTDAGCARAASSWRSRPISANPIPACHAAAGPTRRNEPLYGPPGYAYVYLNYGMHALVNAVVEAEGMPAAVLIRALDPLDGVVAMRRRRARAGRTRRRGAVGAARPAVAVTDLCRGPGNLTVAMGITLDENRVDLGGDRLFIEDRGLPVGPIAWSSRVGIYRRHRTRVARLPLRPCRGVRAPRRTALAVRGASPARHRGR